MSTIYSEKYICAVCGKESELNYLGSTSTFGSPDIDSRPAPLKRHTMSLWTQDCPHCGYTNYTIQELPKSTTKQQVEEMIASKKYSDYNGLELPALAQKFYRYYKINELQKDNFGCYYALLCCAWVCDDAMDSATAIEIRKLAIPYLIEFINEIKKEMEVNKNDEDAIKKYQYYTTSLAECYRKSEQFEKAIRTLEDVEFIDENTKKVAEFITNRALIEDAQNYTVEDTFSEDDFDDCDEEEYCKYLMEMGINPQKYPNAPKMGTKHREGNYEYVFNRCYESNMNFVTNEETGKSEKTYTFRLIDAKLINGWSVKCINNVAEPGPILSEIDGIPITAMECTFANCDKLEVAPELPESVALMSMTFYNCKSLKVAPKIPDNVSHMVGTFENCYSLISAPDFPSNLETEMSVFENCKSLTEIPDLSKATKLTSLSNTFTGCENLIDARDMKYSDNIEGLYETFAGCINLKYPPVFKPNIANFNGTFRNCESLIEIPDLPEKARFFCDTFEGCKSLIKAPKLPDGTDNLYSTFKDCISLIEPPILPKTVKKLSNTFEGCISLTKTPEFPSGIEDMHEVFKDCIALKEIAKLPKGLKKMWYTFAGCTSLEVLPEIPAGMETIAGICEGCTNLKKISIIPDVDYAAGAFDGCTSLTGEIIIDIPTEKYKGKSWYLPNGYSLNYTYNMFENIDFLSQKITLIAGPNTTEKDVILFYK